MSLPLLLALTACRSDKTPQDTGLVEDTGLVTDTQPDVTDADQDGFDSESDCDDSDAAVYPGAEEICDGIDNNCDSQVDEGLLLDVFIDGDSDGYGDSDQPTTSCALYEGLSLVGGDCDDAESLANPGLEEVCNDRIDNDCDGTSNDCAPSGALSTQDALYGLTSSQDYDLLGWEVAGLPDLDGDGLGEVMVGSLYGARESSLAGAAYLLLGQPAGVSEVTEAAELTLTSSAERDTLGAALRGGVDFDGDGQGDLVIGAPGDITNHSQTSYEDRGEVLVLSGAERGSLDAREAALFRIEGHQAGMHSGYALAITDLGGPMLAVGAYEDSTIASDAGSVYLFSAALGSEVSTDDADAVFMGTQIEDHIGVAISLEDLDGDGVADLMTSGPGRIWEAQEEREEERGTLAWMMGPVSGSVQVDDADGNMVGDPDDNLGLTFSLGDMNGDGYLDLAAGAHRGNDGVGGVYLFEGPISAELDLGNAVASLAGEYDTDEAAASLDMSQDMDGDGNADLIVGAWGWPEGAAVGRSYLVMGPISGDGALVDSARAIYGHDGESLSAFGYPVQFVPDATGDGVPDLIMGASYDSQGALYGGAAWVFAGSGM